MIGWLTVHNTMHVQCQEYWTKYPAPEQGCGTTELHIYPAPKQGSGTSCMFSLESVIQELLS